MTTIEEYKLNYALNKFSPINESEKIIYTLIDEFANDKNSSKFREDVTKIMVGLRPSEGKRGYDDDFEAIEVKPVNYTGKEKLNGKGSFSDLTWARHHRYIKDNVKMLISGFQNGKILFIVEFSYSSIQDRLEGLLKKKLPNGDVQNTYVRTAAFNHVHWKDQQYTIKFLHDDIDTYKNIFSKKFFKLLKGVTTNDSQFFKHKK